MFFFEDDVSVFDFLGDEDEVSDVDFLGDEDDPFLDDLVDDEYYKGPFTKEEELYNDTPKVVFFVEDSEFVAVPTGISGLLSFSTWEMISFIDEGPPFFLFDFPDVDIFLG